MAFTATIQSINFQNDRFQIVVRFNDSATSWSATKTYDMDATTTQAQAVAIITADGTDLKANLTKNSALQTKVGTVITI
jgi:hypothetical protein